MDESQRRPGEEFDHFVQTCAGDLSPQQPSSPTSSDWLSYQSSFFFKVFIQTTQSLDRSLLLRDKLLLFRCLEKAISRGNEFSDERRSLQEMKTLEAPTGPNGSAITITEI